MGLSRETDSRIRGNFSAIIPLRPECEEAIDKRIDTTADKTLAADTGDNQFRHSAYIGTDYRSSGAKTFND